MFFIIVPQLSVWLYENVYWNNLSLFSPLSTLFSPAFYLKQSYPLFYALIVWYTIFVCISFLCWKNPKSSSSSSIKQQQTWRDSHDHCGSPLAIYEHELSRLWRKFPHRKRNTPYFDSFLSSFHLLHFIWRSIRKLTLIFSLSFSPAESTWNILKILTFPDFRNQKTENEYNRGLYIKGG